MLLIAVLILVVFSERLIPPFARLIGKSVGEFERARNQSENELKSVAKEFKS